MPVSKIKNLILLILALSAACLLFLVVPTRSAQVRAEQTLHAQLEELFASYDIQLDPDILPRSADLYAVELSGQRSDSASAAAALLGADASLQPDSTHYSSTYTSSAGSCTFRAGGGFSAVLNGGSAVSDLTAGAQKLLRRMGFDIQSISAPQRQSAGIYTVTASQQMLGVPLLTEGLTLTYTNGVLTRLDGSFITGASQLVRTSENAGISCAGALTALLSSRDALGWVGSRITAVQQCYRHADSSSAAMRLTPVWIIETDTGSFCVGGLSREVTVWDSTAASDVIS